MKKYNNLELNVIRKYFKKGKIPKSTYDIDSKLLDPDIDHDMRILLDLAVAQIAKKEDISSIVHSIVQYEKDLDEKKYQKHYVNENLRSHISKDLIDDETLSKLELQALRDILNEGKESIDFNGGVDIYNEYDEFEESHHKTK